MGFIETPISLQSFYEAPQKNANIPPHEDIEIHICFQWSWWKKMADL